MLQVILRGCLLFALFFATGTSTNAALRFQQTFEAPNFGGDDFITPSVATAAARADANFAGAGANMFDGLVDVPGESIWRVGTDPSGNQALAISRYPKGNATFTIDDVTAGAASDVMYFQFDVIVPEIYIGAGLGAGIQIGDNYNPTTDTAENGALSFARLGFNLFPDRVGGPDARLFVPDPERDGPPVDHNVIINGNEPRLDQAVDTNNDNIKDTFAYMRYTWVLNSSGAAVTYDSPFGPGETLADNTHDLFVEYFDGPNLNLGPNTLRVLDDHAAQTADTTLSDIKFFLAPNSNFYGSIVFDNLFVLDALPNAAMGVGGPPVVPLRGGFGGGGVGGGGFGGTAVPEPSAVVLTVALIGFASCACRRRAG